MFWLHFDAFLHMFSEKKKENEMKWYNFFLTIFIQLGWVSMSNGSVWLCIVDIISVANKRKW